MPDVFTDEVGTYDLSITTAADWTVTAGGMPNGDNYVTGDGSIAATYNLNGDDFHIGDGTAWTIEFVFYMAAAGVTNFVIMTNCDAGTSSSSSQAWIVQLAADERIYFSIRNTGGTNFLEVQTGVLTAATWYHVVFIKETTNEVRSYLNATLQNTSTTTSGTVRTPTSTYRLYLGTDGAGGLDMTANHRLAKLAIYNAELTTDQISDHSIAALST